MKNWIKIEYGTYINGEAWETEGIAYLDPSAISSVMEITNRVPKAKGCCIFLGYSGKTYTVRKSALEIIQEVQYALP